MLFRSGVLRRLADQWRFILFEPSPKSIGRALRTVQQGLAAGDAVGIFSEGGISRTGQLLGFKRGLEWVLERAAAPVVPAFIDGMWGSVLSFSEGKFFSKWPRFPGGRRRRVSLWFDAPLPVGTPPREARLAIQDLAARAVRQRWATENVFEQRVAAWSRRHRGGAGGHGGDTLAALACGGTIAADGADADRAVSWPGAVVVGDGGVALDRAALLATAEAFDGCCLVRRTDRLLSSLAPGDPLHVALGILGGPLLDIPSTGVDPDTAPAELLRCIAAEGSTLWLANVRQVAAAATAPMSPGSALEGVVMPIASVAELPAARTAAAAFLATHGVEPVVAFAPGPLGALVSMNTPPRRAEAQERVCRGDSLGRTVTGVAVWPSARQRTALGRDRLDDGQRAFGPPCPAPASEERSLVVAATAPRRGAGGPSEDRQPSWFLLDAPVAIDEDGFLLPVADDLSDRPPSGFVAGRGSVEADRRATELG